MENLDAKGPKIEDFKGKSPISENPASATKETQVNLSFFLLYILLTESKQ